MVRRGRRYVEDQLSFERVSEQHETLYAQVLEQP
jgi:hypothetical protein